ncbi:MAG: dockerin type I repeat-containing protein [Oscillospiraceae bacterium]|nr:dockerin type I repeat-containing protein [Oscillospiraceae bacterium]
MRKHLTALLAAAALTLSAAPLTALAKEELPGSMLPDWVPRDYLTALDFCNTYGKTHIQNGYVCIVRRGVPDRDMHEGFTETRSEEPVEQFIPQFVFGAAEPETDGKDDGFREEVQAHYQFEVSLYKPKHPGELKITWTHDTNPSKETALTFEVAEDGSITETDVFGWLPDSPLEFSEFDAVNPELSVHENYIVYAGTPCYDGGYQECVSLTGTGRAELVYNYGVSQLYRGPLPYGGSSSVIRVYKPVQPGTIRLTAAEKRIWEKEPVYSDTVYYAIDEALNVTETEPAEALYGDVNGDGELSVADLVTLRKYLHGKGTLAKPELSDLDGDGQVDIFDFAELRQLLLVQSPWKDGKLEFTSETVVNPSPYRPENHKACDIKWYGNLDATQSYLNDFDKADAVKLKEITEETFKDHAVLTVASRAGAGDQRFTVESVERKGSRLIVHTDTYHTMFPTPDMAVIYNVIAVDKSAMEGIRDFVVENQDNYQAIT